jgi:hypothetical protein
MKHAQYRQIFQQILKMRPMAREEAGNQPAFQEVADLAR